MVTLTFLYAGKSGMNSGIIASIFSTSVIFSNIGFYFLYGQKLTKYGILGSLLVVGCVILIGLGPSLGGGESKYDMPNLLMSVGFALGTGLVFSFNAININYIINTIGFPAD